MPELAREGREAPFVSEARGQQDAPVHRGGLKRVGSNGSELLALFLESHSPTTMAAYRRDLDDYAAFCGSETPTAIADLLALAAGDANRRALAYRTHLRQRKLSPATINRRLAALRSLSKLARLLGQTTWALEVTNLASEAYRDTRGPGRETVQGMLALAEQSPRDHALLRLLYDLGLRRAEVCSLDVADLETTRLWVLGKGRLEKTPLELPAPTRQALLDWLAVRGSEPGALFTNQDRSGKGDGRLSGRSVHRIVGKYAEALGVSARPHGLRHTAITEACKAATAAGIGIEEVLDFSRHKSLAVLMRYRDRERNVQGKLAALVAGEQLAP
ncbi:tyrosine-type recombinase/integrase [Armatimonas rosea]|uniref:Integrase/recombinase XerC n=1 Tax=Armatimonas rosea TaxID=685828 RepID=A0A7W9STI1_ARMRO|nr:integrase/recombinase XerC [Armatimonas rosea]